MVAAGGEAALQTMHSCIACHEAAYTVVHYCVYVRVLSEFARVRMRHTIPHTPYRIPVKHAHLCELHLRQSQTNNKTCS